MIFNLCYMFYLKLYIFWYYICCIIVLGQSLPPLAQSLNDVYGFDKWNLIVDHKNELDH